MLYSIVFSLQNMEGVSLCSRNAQIQLNKLSNALLNCVFPLEYGKVSLYSRNAQIQLNKLRNMVVLFLFLFSFLFFFFSFSLFSLFFFFFFNNRWAKMELMWTTLVPAIFQDKDIFRIWERDILKLKMILNLRISFLYV